MPASFSFQLFFNFQSFQNDHQLKANVRILQVLFKDRIYSIQSLQQCTSMDKKIAGGLCSSHVVVKITQCDPRPPSTSTFTIAIITNGVGNSPMEYRVSIPNRRGLPDGSVVLANQRRTIDKVRIIKYCCNLDSQTMKRISRACRRAEETDKKRHKRRRKHSNTS